MSVSLSVHILCCYIRQQRYKKNFKLHPFLSGKKKTAILADAPTHSLSRPCVSSHWYISYSSSGYFLIVPNFYKDLLEHGLNRLDGWGSDTSLFLNLIVKDDLERLMSSLTWINV